jgi:glutamate carboxypeptidase
MNAPSAEQILDFVGSQRRPMLKLLRRLVEAESPSNRVDSHRQVRAILSTELQSLGFKVLNPGSPNAEQHVYARPAQRRRFAPRQLVLGHFDTVWPLGTISERPFSVDGNIVRGPGVFDMKGGLAQIIYAMKAIYELGDGPEVEPVIFINADEEIGSRSSTKLIRLLAQNASRAFVLEPAVGEEGVLKTERKGIGRFTITVFGKSAHAGLDARSGASAILELSHVIQTLFSLNDVDRGISVNVGTVDGGMQANVVAAHSKAVVDVRVPTLEAGEEIERAIHAIEPVTPGIRLSIEGGIGRPSMEATPRNQALWAQAKAVGEKLGMDLRATHVGGGSDGNTTSQYTATLDGLGAVGDGAHAEHEFLYIDKTLQRTALLAMLLLEPHVSESAQAECA